MYSTSYCSPLYFPKLYTTSESLASDHRELSHYFLKEDFLPLFCPSIKLLFLCALLICRRTEHDQKPLTKNATLINWKAEAGDKSWRSSSHPVWAPLPSNSSAPGCDYSGPSHSPSVFNLINASQERDTCLEPQSLVTSQKWPSSATQSPYLLQTNPHILKLERTSSA